MCIRGERRPYTVTEGILAEQIEVCELEKIARIIFGKLSNEVNPLIKGMTVTDYAQDGLTKLLCHVTINKVYKYEDDQGQGDPNTPFWERVKQLGTLSLNEEIKILRDEDRQI